MNYITRTAVADPRGLWSAGGPREHVGSLQKNSEFEHSKFPDNQIIRVFMYIQNENWV